MRIEAVADSAADAAAAQRAGADRIELGCAPELGGLTPGVGALRAAKAACTLPVVVLVRPRAGGFCYAASEIDAMASDIAALAAAGADGIVTGCLTEDGAVDIAALARLIAAAGDLPVVFHRAFDTVADPLSALETLVDRGVARVLTSGGAATALDGAERLSALCERAGGRIEILVAGGVRASNALEIARRTGCDQLHLGPRVARRDPTAARGTVDYGVHTVLDEAALAATVRALRRR